MNIRMLMVFGLFLLGLALAPAALSQSDAAADAALVSAAVSNTAAQPAYAFDVFLSADFALDGESLTLVVEGEGAMDNLAGSALSLDLRGQMVANGDDFPIDLALRVQDGVLYYTIAGADADAALWQGVALADAQALIEVAASAGDPASLTELSGNLGQLSALAASSGISSSEFVTVTRSGDGEVDGIPVTDFTVDFSLPNLVQADGFVSFIQGLVLAFPDADNGMLGDNARLFGVVLGNFFENTSIQYRARIDEAARLVRSGELILNATLDPSLLGDTTGPVTLALDLAVNLRDFNQPQPIAVPAGVTVMSGAELMAMFGTGDIAVGGQTLAPTFPTATPSNGVIPTQPPTGPLTALDLAPNVPLPVTVSDAAPAELRYTGAAGELVTISARSLEPGKGLDPVLTLFNAAGVQLARNDDLSGSRPGFGNLDSVIPDVKLPDNAVYTVRVESLTANASGLVEVLITSSFAPGPVPTPGTGTISGGVETLTRSVTSDAVDCVDVTFDAGETVTMTARALDAALDTQLTVFAPDGSQVEFNDDHSSNDSTLGRFDSQIVGLAIANGGAYSLCVSGFAGSSGAYELTIARGSAATSVVNPTPGSPLDSPDEIVLSGSVATDEAFETSFTAQAGDVYTIEVVSATEALDPQLGVYRDVENDVLFYNDDSGGDNGLAYTDSRLHNIIIPDSGVFDVLVTGYDGSAGSFDLTITRTATNGPLGAPETQTFSGKVQTNGVYSTQVTLPEGAYVTITVRAGDDTFDPQLTLVGPNGSVAASNDDHSSEDAVLRFTDSRIRNFFVAAPGVYTLEVQGYQGTGGPFSMTVDILQ